MAFEDFPAARIVYLRAIGIFNIRSEVADNREAGIFQTHGWVVNRPLFSNNRIFETGFFKCHLPVIDTINQGLHPLFGGSRIDVINDLFSGFYQFTALVFFHILGLWLQFPANSESLVFNSLLFVAIDNKAIGKIANTAIEKTTVHWYFGQ